MSIVLKWKNLLNFCKYLWAYTLMFLSAFCLFFSAAAVCFVNLDRKLGLWTGLPNKMHLHQTFLGLLYFTENVWRIIQNKIAQCSFSLYLSHLCSHLVPLSLPEKKKTLDCSLSSGKATSLSETLASTDPWRPSRGVVVLTTTNTNTYQHSFQNKTVEFLT